MAGRISSATLPLLRGTFVFSRIAGISGRNALAEIHKSDCNTEWMVLWQVDQGQVAQLRHLSLVEVGGVRLLFMVNHAAAKRATALTLQLRG